MSKVSFDSDHINEVAFAFYQSATFILKALAEEKGEGPWFEELKNELKNQFKNAEFPDDTPLDSQPKTMEACLTAVDAVFDRVKFR